MKGWDNTENEKEEKQKNKKRLNKKENDDKISENKKIKSYIITKQQEKREDGN